MVTEKWPWIQAGKDPAARGRAITFVLCLVFSFIAWLTIKLSQDTLAVLPLEITITNIPETVIFSTPSDTTFTLSIQTTGIRILSNRNLRKTNRLETDYQMLQRARGENSSILFLTANQAETRFSLINDLPRTAITIHPDTIFFNTAEAFRTKVPVILNKELDYRPGFRLYGLAQVDPDSVFVTGPLWLLDSVQAIHTEPLIQNRIDGNIQETIALVNPFAARQMVLSEKHVDVFVPVEEFTEAIVELPLTMECPELESNNDQSRLLLFPERINLSYLVAMKDIQNITPDLFTAIVSCPDTLTASRARLRVTISEQPGMVEIIRIRPQEVEYLWIKD